MNIIEIIQSNYATLTNKQKMVADYLTNNPSDICYVSLATLSKNIGCSEVTILKICKIIGVDSFIELKEEFRSYNQSLVNKYSVSSYSVPSEITDTDSKIDFLKNICNEELDKIVGFYNSVDLESVLSIAKLICKNHIIYLFAHDASKALASVLKGRFDVLNLNVVLVDLSDMKEVEYIMRQVTKDDVAIFLSFPNYYYSIKSIAENIKHNGCELVLFTDSLDCPVADCTDNILMCNTRTKIFYNSWLQPIALINILTSILAMLIKDSSEF
ncbi:MurR/RpiR family transcriptional regulator [Romboutsia weinsteinii]|uniref:MurR/RpiR family transcriptional regulator n=1 Tax=Romboutsia weinsteinii TaxID=2020949 RepID=A0A371J4D0_9FIRM|nr:MurR/RpiR family transcriptional regulator [Romboutsia weinsteinii]RDY27595.1 MurR/RpiR family transcriptional regulator [Romboutsia weinsteinii]